MRSLLAVFVVAAMVSWASAEPPWRYYSKEKEDAIRATFPVFEDKQLQRRLQNAVIYDDDILPNVFFDPTVNQSPGNWTDATQMVRHNPDHTISAEDSKGSPNNEEPWLNTGGLPRTYRKVNALILPENGAIQVWTGPDSEESRRLRSTLYWEFPVGTIVLEFMYQRFSDGTESVFNVRQRVKNREGRGAQFWGSFDQYRPIRNQTELRRALFLPSAPPKFSLDRLVSRHRQSSPDSTALTTKLPKLPMETSKLLLKRPFRSTVGEPRHTENGLDCDMAESDHPDSIVPVGYQGRHFTAKGKTCVNCHQDTKRYAFDLENPRPWYVFVRGDDGIFSWHPLDESVIPATGQFGAFQPLIKASLIESGKVKIVNR